MANLNLSEFTEKLFVADADHTFIWDTAASISKRVSRNSWLNSGTLTSDAPVTISQTWAGTGSTVFTAFKVNATSTASDPTSKLLDLQLGGASQLSVSRGGSILSKVGIIASNGSANAAGLSLGLLFAGYGLGVDANGNTAFLINGLAKTRCGFGVAVASDQSIGWTNAAHVGADASLDTILLRDGAANTLALRNGAAAQTFNVYGTYTSGSVYERMFMRYNGTDLAFQVGAETLGATARPLQLWTGGASRLHITTAGNVGIGTTAPGAKLEVVENTANVAGLFLRATSVASPRFEFIDGAATTNRWSFGCGATSTTDGKFFIYDVRQNLNRIVIDTAGNVGIGTTSPTSKLQVSAGDVEVDTIAKGVILKSPDGTRYRVTVANGGTLSVAAV